MLITPTNSTFMEWEMAEDKRKLALLYMDYSWQVDKIVLNPGITPEEGLKVLRIAASHASRYVVHRYISGGILDAEYTGTASTEKSLAALQDGVVSDEIQAMDTKKLEEGLNRLDIEVVWATVWTFQEALESAVKDLPVTFQLGDWHEILSRQRVTFTAESPGIFRAWHSVGKPRPGQGFDLYVVPAYHPDMADEKTSTFLVNGSTDALIRGRAIYSIFAPGFSDEVRRHFLGNSWSETPHPFYAEGTIVKMDVSPTQALSEEGIDLIKSVLAALLEQDNQYLSVSGGFRNSRLPYPQNVANRANIRTSSGRGEVRGSEGFCVWAYQVLEDEGELERAYVPSWLHSERWLEAYGNLPVHQ